MTGEVKEARFLNLVMAFQHFAGKPLKTIEAARALSDHAIETMEGALLTVADELDSMKAEDLEGDLGRLAEKIRSLVGNS